jgi:all-trans-retinol 13,14-reductase
MHFCHTPNPVYAQSGVILSYMQMSDVQQWEGTHVGRRGADYEEFKRKKAERLIDAIEGHFPGFKDSIAHYYTSTPLTYVDYTGTEGGSLYGIAKDINKGSEYSVPHRTKVPNLLFTGQNINSHGMLGVIVGAIVTCSELLTSKKIYEQIIDANR